ncbi:MAG: FAD-binding protein [bacterium]
MNGERIGLAVERLSELIASPERILTGADDAAGYVADGAGAVFCVVLPRNEDEAVSVVKLANAMNFAVYTPMIGGLAPEKPGIVMDLRKLEDVIAVDERNLLATVGAAVTFDRLADELKKYDCRVWMPAAAPTDSVLLTYLEREILFAAGRYTNRQLAVVHAVLPDGRPYRSGSHALPGATVSHREDGGPNVSKLLFQSKNTFGVPIRGVVNVYPRFEARKVVAFGFKNFADACEASRLMSNAELLTECFVADRAKFAAALGEARALPAWILGATIEASNGLADYYEKEARKIARGREGRACVESVVAMVDAGLGRPWRADGASVGFYTTFDRLADFDRVASETLGENGAAGVMVVPVKRAVSAYAQYDAPAGDAARSLREKLLEKGVFFSNPAGDFAKKALSTTGNYRKLLMRIKSCMDKRNVLNPGQIMDSP